MATAPHRMSQAQEKFSRLTVSQAIQQNEISKGIAIIIGNQLSIRYPKDVLKGPYFDLSVMESAFKTLRYTVLPFLNASKQEILEIVREVSQLFPVESCKPLCYRRIVFLFAGHGHNNQFIHAEDGDVDVNQDVVYPLMPEQSPNLANIPKLIFIDACRGKGRDPGVCVSVPRGEKIRVPKLSNYLLVYSTLPTMKAFENDLGGFWMQTLARELCNPCNIKKGIHGIIIEVNRQLIGMLNNIRHDLQQPEYHGTLLEDVNFLSEEKELQEFYQYPKTVVAAPFSSCSTIQAQPSEASASYGGTTYYPYNASTHQPPRPVGDLMHPVHNVPTVQLQGTPSGNQFPSYYPVMQSVHTPHFQQGSVFPSYDLNAHSLENPIIHAPPAVPFTQSQGVRGGAELPADHEATKTSTSSMVPKSTHSSIVELKNLLIEKYGPSAAIDYSLKETGRGFKATVHAPLIGYAEGEECSSETKAKRSAASKAIEKLRMSVD